VSFSAYKALLANPLANPTTRQSNFLNDNIKKNRVTKQYIAHYVVVFLLLAEGKITLPTFVSPYF
jgi:hypothetical protein